MAIAPTEPDLVRVRVPAKINLALAVGAPDNDGYHPLTTVFQAVSLYDEVVAEWDDPATFTATVDGEFADGVGTGDDNLAVRAARALAAACGGDEADMLGAHLSLRKGIPVAAGMAGGSADAAAALVACAALWELNPSPEELADVARTLGSDVPFALVGGNAVGTGRGDRLMTALGRGTQHWVLAISDKGLSTPSVYRRFDELTPQPGEPHLDDTILRALAGGNPEELAACFRNDLQAPALDLRPELADVLAAGNEAGALAGLVSGSGPTVAFLARNEQDSLKLSTVLAAAEVAPLIKRATGPVPGARIIY